MSAMEELSVVCAVIRDGDRYLACQRSESMREALLWEFPGGKVEAGEGIVAALHRELQEELGATVSIRGVLRPSRWPKSNKIIVLHPLLCVLQSPELRLKEHKDSRWLRKEEFSSVTWCEPDLPILEILGMPALEDSRWWL